MAGLFQADQFNVYPRRYWRGTTTASLQATLDELVEKRPGGVDDVIDELRDEIAKRSADPDWED